MHTPPPQQFGLPIVLDDQGVYYTLNRNTGSINNVFRLVYDEDDWYLYQLKNTNKDGDMGWVILADQGDYALTSVDTHTVRQLFDRPEFSEPKGAWQLLRNSRYGFGKFTPQDQTTQPRYAMILFSGDDMLVPLLIEKADDELQHHLIAVVR